jgi:hypothetical protein
MHIRDRNKEPRPRPKKPAPREIAVPEIYQILVDCGNEARQQEVFERLTSEGMKCRLLTL